MGDKAPAFQFYVKDWLADTELRMASPASRGLWMDCLCYMWVASEKGKLSGTVESISRLLSVNREDFEHFLAEAEKCGFADVSREGHGEVTVINRRLYRQYIDRENARLRKQRQRESQAQSRQSHGDGHGIIRGGHEKVTANVTPKKAVCQQGVPSMSRSGEAKGVTVESRALTYRNRADLVTGHGDVPTSAATAGHSDVTAYSSSPRNTSKITPSSPPEQSPKKSNDYTEDFERFWSRYPKKRNKPQAFRTWKKAVKDGVLPPEDDLFEAIEARKQSREWTKQDGRYIPHPSTWINGHGWNDDFSVAVEDDSKQSFRDRAAMIYQTVCEANGGERGGDNGGVIEVGHNLPMATAGQGIRKDSSPRIFEGFKALPGPGLDGRGGYGD